MARLPGIKFSIRTRIITLVVGAVAFSVGSQSYFGASLMIEDKTSYIFQRDSAVISGIAERFESKINDALAFNDFTGVYLRGTPPGAAPSSELDQLYELNENRLGITGLAVLETNSTGEVVLSRSFGSGNTATGIFAEQKWDETSFKAGSAIGLVKNSSMPLATKVDRPGASPFYVVTMLKVTPALLEGKYPEMELRLVDRSGRSLLAEEKNAGGSELATYIQSIFANDAATQGVRKIDLGEGEFLAGYKKIAHGRILALSLVPASAAYSAAQALLVRALVIALSIFFIAIGLVVMFIKRLVVRVRQLYVATELVSKGDYSARIDMGKAGSDELDALAKSFNAMSGKISALIVETAEKARMEKELETAQAVQSGFFPKAQFESEALKVHGAYQPASECAGDWWGYASSGNMLYVAIGDVTGHGASSALVTAAVHGVFYDFMGNASSEADPESLLKDLITRLNRTVCAIGRGETMMTFLVVAIHPETGVAYQVNASHLAPWKSKETGGYATMKSTVTQPLGYAPEALVSVNKFSVTPGEHFILCTDGFFEPYSEDGQAWKKHHFQKFVGTAWEETSGQPQAVVDSIVHHARSLFPGAAPDDITVVIVSMPMLALPKPFLRAA